MIGLMLIVGLAMVGLGISLWLEPEKKVRDVVSPTRCDRRSKRYAR